MRRVNVKTEGLQQVPYAPPAIEVTDITLEQNVLGGGSMYDSQELPDLDGEDW